MAWEAGNGQSAPPARRVRVSWCPSRHVPASACVISPPPRGEGASGTPWAHFEWGMAGIEITGNVRRAAATASRLYWSLLELPTPPLTSPREGADRPLARNSPRRTPQVARSAVAPTALGQLFGKLGYPENVWVCGQKKRVPVHIWCLADCQKIRPTACQKCMRWVSCVKLLFLHELSFRDLPLWTLCRVSTTSRANVKYDKVWSW